MYFYIIHKLWQWFPANCVFVYGFLNRSKTISSTTASKFLLVISNTYTYNLYNYNINSKFKTRCFIVDNNEKY